MSTPELPRLVKDAVYELREPMKASIHTCTHVRFCGYREDQKVVMPEDRRMDFELLAPSGTLKDPILHDLKFATWWPAKDVNDHVALEKGDQRASRPIGHVVKATELPYRYGSDKTYQVLCPYCGAPSTWRDGSAAGLDGCKVKCLSCNQGPFTVVTR